MSAILKPHRCDILGLVASLKVLMWYIACCGEEGYEIASRHRNLFNLCFTVYTRVLRVLSSHQTYVQPGET
jgi:hypothetical protein